MSTPNLLTPPNQIPPATALALSQKAPPILSSPPTSTLPFPLSLLLSSETPSTWSIHENAFLAALRTGDESTARALLDRLTTRFGSTNERIITLNGLYREATAKSTAELEEVFKEYETILREDDRNFAVRKRRVAVLKGMGRMGDAITALSVLLEYSPTDVEAWAEIGDLYAGQGAWAQSVFALEEVLLAMPNSWSAHAHIATIHYLSALSASNPPPASSIPALALSLKHFSRSLELNTSYLRAFYGLKLVSKTLVPLLSDAPPSNSSKEEVQPPKLATVKKLEELATKKLGEIIRNASSGKAGWTGYDEAEIIAARELLDRDGRVER